MRISLLFLTVCCLLSVSVQAQPAQSYIRVQVTPDHTDWVYAPGQSVPFRVSVLKNNIPLKDIGIRWKIGEEMMPSNRTGKETLKNGTTTLQGGTMDKPGFLRCTVQAEYDGKIYEGSATAAFDPWAIKPTQTEPADFDRFWQEAIAANADIPLEPIMTLMPERCTGRVNVYQVSLQNYRRGSRFYGILCMPKAPGKYPAVLHFPGAGVRPYNGDIASAATGIITLQIEIHGVPHDLPAKLYNELYNGPLYDYPQAGLDDRNRYYYKRVYLGCLRAVDLIFSLPEFDGRLCVQGGSQGGALSIVTAALDPRVNCLVSHFPALCDLTGYLHSRAGGWPHLFRNPDDAMNTPERIGTTAYYDVVNFAKRLKVPGFYTLGYNDTICPPTSTLSAYNAIQAPKEIFVVEETGHYDYPEQWEKVWAWIHGQLRSGHFEHPHRR